MNHLSDDTAFDLVHELLAPDEEASAVAHVRECRACAELVRECDAARERLRAGPQPVVHNDGSWTLEPRGVVRPETSRVARRRIFLLPALAVAAVLALLVWLPRGEAPAPVVRWLPVEDAVGLRSPGPGGDAMIRGLVAYGAHDAPAAARLLAAAEDDDPVRRLYLASALSLSGESDEALRIVEALGAERLPPPWRDRALWTRYVCLRDLGRGEAARTLRDRLAGGTGDVATWAKSEPRD